MHSIKTLFALVLIFANFIKNSYASVKNKTTPVLRDENNIVEAVPITGEDVQVQRDARLQPAPLTRSQLSETFDYLLDVARPLEILETCRGMDEREFMKHLCPVVTTVERFSQIFNLSMFWRFGAYFFALGDLKVIEKILCVKLGFSVINQFVYTAVLLSLMTNDYDRTTDLLAIAQKIYAKYKQPKSMGKMSGLETLMTGAFNNYSPKTHNAPLKRFLIHRGKELSEKHPYILEAFCQPLLRKLKSMISDSDDDAIELLKDLVAQPDVLTPAMFSKAFLVDADDAVTYDFIKYGWNKAIEEGLKQEYPDGGKYLWRVMVKDFPEQFHGEYPHTDELREAALRKFRTKKEIEKDWIETGAFGYIKTLETLPHYDNLPKALWGIVIEYAWPTNLDVQEFRDRLFAEIEEAFGEDSDSE